MSDLLAPKQIQFINESTRHWNLAHGSVRSGKTVGTLFRFMQAANDCPDSQIFMVGHSSETIYQNAIRLLLESRQFDVFQPFCTWYAGKRQLKFRDKTISTLGAKDEGAIGQFQGKTMSLVYCDEMTLYPESIFDFFDRNIHIVPKPPRAAEYWIAGIDFGTSNAFACVLIGVSTGQYTQTGKCMWVEKEYYWNSKQTGRQKVNSEYARDVEEFLEPYSVRGIYIDPSAAAMKLEL